MIKVQPSLSWAGLCKDCQNSIVREDNQGRRELICQATYHLPRRLKAPPVVCNSYRLERGADYSTMKEIAWIVNSDKKTGKIGFLSPLEWKKAHPEEDY